MRVHLKLKQAADSTAWHAAAFPTREGGQGCGAKSIHRLRIGMAFQQMMAMSEDHDSVSEHIGGLCCQLIPAE